MKKIGLILCTVMLLLCTACGGTTAKPDDASAAADQAAAQRSAYDWLALLREKLPFDDQMRETDQTAAIYGILEEDGYTGETAMLISTMATPEEVAVLQADETYSVQALCDLAKEHIAQKTADYQTYAPTEVPKLESALIRTVGDYVIVCVCADNALAAQVIDAAS